MNLVVLQGNLVRDPELKYFDSNGKQTAFLNITIAVSRYYKKNDGTSVKDATFIPCEAYDSGAETLAKIFKKGDSILVEEGTLREYQWEKDGVKQSRMRVRINKFQKLNRTPKDQTEAPVLVGAGVGEAGDEPKSGEDIPF